MDRTRMLAEMGIKPLWRLRVPAAGAAEPVEVLQAVPTPHAMEAQMHVPAAAMPALETHAVSASPDDWASLQAKVSACQACGLCKARKQAVLGVGDVNADWMFIGEGPGAEEDERGEPFVGQAGKLLDAMLAASGLTRGENVYIANAVKCRPPGNRTPEATEMAACRPFLDQQIAMVKPKLIVALGRAAAQTLSGTEMSISAARGRLHKCGDVPMVVTFHPAYLLRTPRDKAKAWADLCLAMGQISG